jgi:hypothetical protein
VQQIKHNIETSFSESLLPQSIYVNSKRIMAPRQPPLPLGLASLGESSSIVNVFGNDDKGRRVASSWSEEQIENVSRSWGLSVQQKAALVQLGERLRQDLPLHPNNTEVQVIRFLEDRSWNVNAAERMFRKSMEWREQFGADSVFLHGRPPQAIIDNIPGTILKDWDKEGDPIFMDCSVDAKNLEEIIDHYGSDMLVRHAIWMREMIVNGKWHDAYELQQGRPVRQILIIADLNGLTRRHLNRKILSVFGTIMRVTQDNYPGLPKKIVLIRAPAVFRLLWSLIKHFFDPPIVAKMVICGHENYRHVLAEYVDLKVLPRGIVPEGEGAAIAGMPQLAID